MEVALKALGVGWGDEVIIPALTFAATPYAAMAAGALPVFVDVEPARWTIDPDLVEAAITPTDAGDHARPPRPADGRHGPDHGDRAAPRPVRRRGLRARPRPALGRPGRRHDRRLRLVQPPVHQDPDRRRGRHADDAGRAAGAAGALADRLRPAQGRRRARVHVRRQLPARRAGLRAARERPAPVPGPARAPGGARRALRAPGGRHPGRHDQAPQPADHALELLPLHLRDRPGRVRRRDQRAGRRRDLGRGRPGRGAVPADEPLRPVPAVAVAAARGGRARRPARPGADELPGRRGRRRAHRRLPQRVHLPLRRGRRRARRRGARQGAAAGGGDRGSGQPSGAARQLGEARPMRFARPGTRSTIPRPTTSQIATTCQKWSYG